MASILVLSPERVRARMAGNAIRSTEMARQLAADGHDVCLASPQVPPEIEVPFDTAAYEPDDIDHMLHNVDYAVISGHLMEWYFDARRDAFTIVDLYDPFVIEHLYYAETLGSATLDRELRSLKTALAQGDFFLCSSREQRLFYVGLLLSVHRLDGETFLSDPNLQDLIVEVPFGVPSEPPQQTSQPLRDHIPDLSDPLIFFGGIYDWYDPETMLRAFSRVLEALPRAKLIFVENPNPETTPLDAYRRTLDEVERRGWLNETVFFVPWFDYAQRANYYLSCDLAVVTHHPSIETELAMRTRIFDFLWAGVPVIAQRGGPLPRVLEQHDAGRVVDPGDESGLAATMIDILEDAEAREGMTAKGRALAQSYTWPQVLRPLREFVDRREHRLASSIDPSAGPERKVLQDRTTASSADSDVNPAVTIVIATHNRKAILVEVLDALAGQEDLAPDDLEVIVVSDGSTDGTTDFLAQYRPPYPFRFLAQQNLGQSVARNRAVNMARGRRLIFLGDDTIPDARLVREHLDKYRTCGNLDHVCVLGYTDWDEDLRVTPFLRWLNEQGMQFGYALIDDPNDVPWNFFYTSNVSMDRDLFLQVGGFDPAMTIFEDPEFAYRAAHEVGIRICYHPSAKCAHYHPMTVRSFCNRQRRVGRLGAATFYRKHPELADFLGVHSIHEIPPRHERLALALAVRLGHAVPPLFRPNWAERLLRSHYLIGLKEGLCGATAK